jgi:predicted RNA-binding protein YlxR (DUF448 family)
MESKPKKELLRLVNRGGSAFIDESGKANGRGIYLCLCEECFDKAKKKKAITRGLGIEGAGTEWYEILKEKFMKAVKDREVLSENI